MNKAPTDSPHPADRTDPPDPAGSRPPVPARQAAPAKGGERRLGKWVRRSLIVVAGACIAGIVYVRWHAAAGDFATVNIQTLILAFFGLVALLVRILVRSDIPLVARLIRVGVVVVPLCAVASCLRIDHVSGSLVPALRWRWTPRPDELLAPPQIADSGVRVDLVSTTPEDFPQFLGPRRDLCLPDIQLARDWTTQRPQELWRHPIGAGWSGFSAVNGHAVTMEQRGGEELVTCYALPSGRALWSHSVPTRHETLAGGIGPRCTPTIDEGLVYALGATGILRCIDGADGELLWRDDILDRIGVTADEDLKAISWGRAASPLIVDNLVVVPLGGPAGGECFSLIAYDKKTGEVCWKGGDAQASYASPAVGTLCGLRQIVIVNEDTVSGHHPEDGRTIWSYPWPGESFARASASQAVILPGDCVLLSKDYGIGAELIHLTLVDDKTLRADRVWYENRVLKTKFTNVVVAHDHIFGLSDGIFECVALEDGKSQWKDRRRGRFGHGQILAVGDVILVQAESGEVIMVEPNPKELVELGRFAPLSDQTWNNLCLYGPYLLVRNAVEAACYQLPLRDVPQP